MDDEPPKKKRASKYRRRDPSKVAPLRFGGDRDEEIIRAVGLYRFVWTNDLNDLLVAKGFSNRKKNRERMSRLADAHYLDYPDKQPALADRNPGSLPTVLALGDRGATEYYRMIGWKAPKGSWRQKNKDVGYDSITHALIGSRAMLMLELSAEQFMHGWVERGSCLDPCLLPVPSCLRP